VVGIGRTQTPAAADDSLRRALDQLSASYADAQHKLREQTAAIRTLTESLAVARTESEMFQKLWTQAQVRVQTLGSDLTDTDSAATQRQLVETLRALYTAEAERQRLVQQLGRLVAAVESNGNVEAEIAATKSLLAASDNPGPTTSAAGRSTLDAAKVLEVNLKLRLVVLDVGAQQGARIGMPLLIFRSDRVVGELRIIEVRPKICGALIEKLDNNVTLQAGDTAQLTKS
jgi:hypothetical protein